MSARLEFKHSWKQSFCSFLERENNMNRDFHVPEDAGIWDTRPRITQV